MTTVERSEDPSNYLPIEIPVGLKIYDLETGHYQSYQNQLKF